MAFHSNFIIIHEYKEVKAIPMLTNASIINESFTFSGIVICVHHLIRLLISITFLCSGFIHCMGLFINS